MSSELPEETILIEQQGNEWKATAVILQSANGSTPREALGHLLFMSGEAAMILNSHPDLQAQFMRQYGPKTDEEAFLLFKRVFGYPS